MKLYILIFALAIAKKKKKNKENEELLKQTWDTESEELTEDGAETIRYKGNLDAGYWCDQRDLTTDVMTLDSLAFRHNFSDIREMDSRIIGGQNAQENAWRWIGYFYGCGSTLIASDWAVTAAHCCTIPVWYFEGKELCFGRDQKNIQTEGEQCAGIAEIIQHPEYDRSETVLNDICLLRLKRKIEYSATVQPVCIPQQGMSMETTHKDVVGNQQGENNNCYVAGWGYRQEDWHMSLPTLLQDAKVNVLANETCDTSYTETSESGITIHYYRPRQMSCFGHLGGHIDACQGDSGGPLVCLEESGAMNGHVNPVLRGVVSWGEGCARPGKPGVYARMANYVDWIHETIRTNAVTTNNKCRPPLDVFNVRDNVILDCSHEMCVVHCKDAREVPNVQEIKCDEKRGNYSPLKPGMTIECARDLGEGQSLFMKCGALSRWYELDTDKLHFDCKASTCRITAKDPTKWEPNISKVWCVGGVRPSYDGSSVTAFPAESITKGCGSFFERFPEALEQGIKAKCSSYSCAISPPDGAFIVYPTERFKCHQTQWKIGSSPVESDMRIESLTFDEYDDLDNPYTKCRNPKSKNEKTIWEYVSSFITPEFGPPTSVSNRFGTDSASMAKAKCVPDAQNRNIDCNFYCPNAANRSKPRKIAQRFRCITRTGAWKPKLSGRLASKLKCN